MSVFLLCEQAVGLVRGKRLILSDTEKNYLENLNYEALTNAHSQDEAVVCALHFARVRDRLLQIYPWVFARQSANITGGVLPSDCLTVLAVLVNGEPVEYEQSEAGINIYKSCNVHYTARITNTDKWSAIFRDVFCYSLAIEINSAVTGEPQFSQLLEQKAQELILRAQQIGAIQSETRITVSEELYQRAIGLVRGQRTIKPTSTQAAQQGIDTAGIPDYRTNEEIAACKRAAPNVRDKLLQLYPWTFARSNAVLSSNLAGAAGWGYGFNLPADCMTVLTVLADKDGAIIPVEFEQSGNTNLYCDYSQITVRYTRQIQAITEWPASFKDAFVYLLASEVMLAVTPANEGTLNAIKGFEQAATAIIQQAYKIGVIRAETRLPIKNAIIARAVGLLRGIPSGEVLIPDERSQDEAASALRVFASVRDKLLASYPWVFARKTATPAMLSESVPGYKYTFALPSDCLKVINVITKDSRSIYDCENQCDYMPEYPENVELVNYETTANELYSNCSAIYIRYTYKIEDISKWAAEFTEAFCVRLAIEIAFNTKIEANVIKFLEQRYQQIIQEAQLSRAIYGESGLPKFRESRRHTARQVPYLDYSGIPTRPCSPLDYCGVCVK